jgi:myo-inositol 2-dehydrogenase/D-chiro-inositol 1-dehydrogenase
MTSSAILPCIELRLGSLGMARTFSSPSRALTIMLSFCLFGAGRIGTLHAGNIAAHPGARLKSVVDIVPEAAAKLAARYGATAVADPAAALADPETDAVLIASSTDTHVDLLTAAARAGKAILCEKPIDLSIARVDACLTELARHSVPVQIGFNRRFDPGNAALHQAIRDGEIGDLHLLVICSRDPEPPPLSYVKVSGGLFRDMAIHDFDLARWLTGEEPVEVMAAGSCRIDPSVKALGDVDTAMIILRTAKGTLCHINNSRQAVYGYDQRVEAFGAKGMLRTENHRPTSLRRSTASATDAQDPLLHFFLERYAASYARQLDAFINAVVNRTPTPTNAEDGRQALRIAEAALESSRTGRSMSIA